MPTKEKADILSDKVAEDVCESLEKSFKNLIDHEISESEAERIVEDGLEKVSEKWFSHQ